MLPFLTSVLFLFVSGLMIFTPNLGEVHGWLGQLHIHIFHVANNDLRNSQITKPLMVRRNDKPGSMLGARLVKHVLERLRVIIPVVALFIIRFTDLPLAIGVTQPLLKSGKLFLL